MFISQFSDCAIKSKNVKCPRNMRIPGLLSIFHNDVHGKRRAKGLARAQRPAICIHWDSLKKPWSQTTTMRGLMNWCELFSLLYQFDSQDCQLKLCWISATSRTNHLQLLPWTHLQPWVCKSSKYEEEPHFTCLVNTLFQLTTMGWISLASLWREWSETRAWY